jgi:hypothetical protein
MTKKQQKIIIIIKKIKNSLKVFFRIYVENDRPARVFQKTLLQRKTSAE